MLAAAAGSTVALLCVVAPVDARQNGGEPAQPPPPPAAAAPASVAQAPEVCDFPVSRFVFEYVGERHPSMPEIEELLAQSKVTLTRINEGFVGPRESVATGEVSVADLNAMLPEQDSPRFSRIAVKAVMAAVVNRLREMGVLGVLVETETEDLVAEKKADAPGGEEWIDLRDPGSSTGRKELRLKVYSATIGRTRTVAGGERVTGEAERINSPVHERIARGSPLRAYAAGDQERADLIIKPILDDYVLKLNRTEGRRVDIALSGGENPNEVILDYLVRENNPLSIYAQVSNTGTKETSRWRERIGLIHNQLSGNDDQLTIDYVTGAFENTNIVNGTYTIPLDDVGDWKVKGFAGYSEFDASAVGQAGERFTGDSYTFGAEVIHNVFQERELFIDLYANLKYQHVSVNNSTVQVEGATGFFLPGFGARLERNTDRSVSHADVGIEFNVAGVDTDPAELNALGRLNTDEHFAILKFSGDHSFYLEPIFDGDNFAKGESTLAHEIYFNARGQYTFGARVVPNYQAVAGGFYTVRGYDESISAGDNIAIFTGEYRVHIPRLLAVEEVPGTLFDKPFRYAPQQPYGRPDWDLIARGFIDVARVLNNDRLPFESNATLVGTGIGLEALYNRELNLDIRLDLGMAMKDIPRKAEAGDLRLHFSATIVF